MGAETKRIGKGIRLEGDGNPRKGAKSGQGFAAGVGVLTVSAVVVKLMGLFFRIPLLSRLGTEGMGYFNTAYELYAFFCVISTAGLPVAMSMMIAACNGPCDRSEAVSPSLLCRTAEERIFRVSLGAFAVVGSVGSILLYALSGRFAAFLGNAPAALCMRAVSPTVLLVCLESAYRGYFQGKRNMLPTAISQLTEAGGKLFLGLIFADVARLHGADLPHTAAWAVTGLTAGTAISLLYLFVRKRPDSRKAMSLPPEHPFVRPRPESFPSSGHSCRVPEESRPLSGRQILSSLTATAVPITVSAAVLSLTKCLDVLMILRRMQSAGVPASEANALYGCYSTLVLPVFHILPSLTTSVAMTAVPALSGAAGHGREGQKEVRKIAASALMLAVVPSVPAAFGLHAFSGDILRLLFSGQPEAVETAAPWLACLGLSIPAACLVTVTGAMLQASGHASAPVVSMLAGTAVKGLLAFVLIGHPTIGMMGAPLSSLACDTVMVALNLACMTRLSPDMLPSLPDGIRLFFVPLFLSALSVGGVVRMRRFFRNPAGFASPLVTVGTIMAVMCLYGGLCLLWMSITGSFRKGNAAFRTATPVHKSPVPHEKVLEKPKERNHS